MSHLLASRQMQADTAGLTGAQNPPSVPEGAPAPTTWSEAVSSAVTSEAGSLHYLFDTELLRPASTELHAVTAPRGPNGGRVVTLPGPAVPAGLGFDTGGEAVAAQPAPDQGGAVAERAAATARGWLERARGAFAREPAQG